VGVNAPNKPISAHAQIDQIDPLINSIDDDNVHLSPTHSFLLLNNPGLGDFQS
jgi:hypothetical protein